MTPPANAAIPAGSPSVEAILSTHRRQTARRALVLAGLAVLLALSFLADLATGPSGMGLAESLSALLGREDASRLSLTILWQVRLPTAVAAVLVGAALSVAGAEMQTILDNPLAEPFTLGVSTAASLGAALAIVLGIGLPGLAPEWLIAANAFVFAFGATLLLGSLARGGGGDSLVLILSGIGLFFTFNALTALLQFVASSQALQQLVFWTLGSLAQPNGTSIHALAFIVALVFPFSLGAARSMNALRLGLERASSFGIDVGRLRFLSLLRISLLASGAVAVAGLVGFIGLVGPHIARRLSGEDHRFLLPASALTGALVLSLASIASKLVLPGVLLPIGIVTALIGLPLFFALVLSGRVR